MSACAGDTAGAFAGTPRAALLALPCAAPTPPPRTLAVRNNLIQTFRIEHSDGTATLFAELPLHTRKHRATVISSALDGPGEHLLAAPR